MLKDPLKLQITSLDVVQIAHAPLTNVDLGSQGYDQELLLPIRNVDAGNVTREFTQGGVKYTLSVSSQETRENKPVGTDRTAIRLSARVYDATAKQDIVASATLVSSIPRVGMFSSGTQGLRYQLVSYLINLLIFGEKEEGNSNQPMYALSPNGIRMLNGEG